ncbi:SphA family protein [Xanthomonas oryzae pv. oryzicola]|uniref:SphA family protein n=1 Tax=Xanthomonas oryzae TaxID=347 RepID=UPI000466BB3F|nr:transporter [Xanthomonas oryzae]AJQ89029.1 phenol degradation protein meta [Xanthomonas oryzae pv. oryzicola]AKK63010.1 phenol degradation protein meta [Xanthomonas oryzae pv. oryzicola]AKN92366.1 phenol degradation protein meta [Xanthomonas oryzae pv. oryzicola]AKN96102.1 phenol degradation protein meta [Xanthomonas oryzae pv. oryzicola]AKO01849.1 phenol degradation protein meta [Xanthomonas oryzae pv. oryzicola]
MKRLRSSVRCGSVLPRALSRRQPALIIAVLLAAASPAAWAQAVPETAAVPQGINLGGTSFLDGFSSMKPGWTVIEYLRHADFDAIKNASGDNSPAFRDPKIGTSVLLTQLIYVTPYTWKGSALSFNAIVPLVNYDTSFAADSPVRLSSNGLGVGDISFGPALQMPPVMRDGRVFFFQRFAIDAFAPVGKFDRAIAINQSTGFWSVAPHWAFTVQPTDKWEISGRVNYLYNFRSNRAGGVPPIPGFQFRNGQAGDALWVNFASSVKVTEQLRLGVNGFYLQQLKDNRTNGERVADSKRRQFYAGPGLSWGFNEKNLLNVNVYLPIDVENSVAGNTYNLMFVHSL